MNTDATQPEPRAFTRLLLQDRLLWRGPPSQSPRFAEKQRLSEALLAGLGPARQALALPELDGASANRAALLELTEGLTRPAVLRGFYADNETVQAWDEARLRARLVGHLCSPLSWEGELRERGWDLGAQVNLMDFAELFERMDRDGLYLNNSTEVATACPELVEAMDLPRLQRRLLEPDTGWDELVFLNFFLGGAGVYSELHAAPAGNFFINLLGRKRWVLLEPRYTPHVHGVTRSPWQVFRSAHRGFRAWADEGRAAECPLNPVPRFEVTLEPGDLLYNPPWWWHEVENLDAFTLGCACRHVPTPFHGGLTWASSAPMTAVSVYPVARALTYAHYLGQRVTGSRRPLRARTEALNTWLLRRVLARAER
ncbi:MAG: cupin-like domain-containing protein [Alphaproteobacteria bacterium]|nr:cupin-like domain-containing protein [Alphaproteobacteria bacterium]